MSSLRISGRSGEYTLIDGKFIQNKDTGLYLRHVRDSFVEESGLFNSGDGDFMWQVKEGKVVSYHDVVYAGDVEGADEDDVPVSRASALIEEALNAKAAEEEEVPVVEEEVPVVEEEVPVVEEEVPVVEEEEVSVVEEEVPTVEEEVPELVDADAS